jgi:hypothetical protein
MTLAVTAKAVRWEFAGSRNVVLTKTVEAATYQVRRYRATGGRWRRRVGYSTPLLTVADNLRCRGRRPGVSRA